MNETDEFIEAAEMNIEKLNQDDLSHVEKAVWLEQLAYHSEKAWQAFKESE